MVAFQALFLFSLSLLGTQCVHNDYYIINITNTSRNHIEKDKGPVYQGIFATAAYNGTDEFFLKPMSTMAKNLNVSIDYESDQEFTVLITRSEKPPRFHMPHEYPYSYTKTKPEDYRDPDYKISINENPFSFNVQRTSTKEMIFDTSMFDFVYSEFFLTFGTTLPSKHFYGMGERNSHYFQYNTGIYTIWCKDQFAMVDNGLGNQETYGAHPVYLVREASGNWHMVLLRTTNAMDFIYNATKQTLQYMITGGEIELKFFLGDRYPETAIKLYHTYLNKWAMMPFWSFGYHQSRWGYLYLEDLVDVVENMTANNLPIDVIWSDIDYMNNFTDFTVAEERFNLEDFRKLLNDVRWVPIIDAGVFIDFNTPAYTTGTEYNVWVRSAQNFSNYLVGVVWPGLVHWPDWLNPNASKYWHEMLELLYSYVPFSGIWIDMNENSNFCTGEYPNDCFFLPNYLPVGGNLPFNLTPDAMHPIYYNNQTPVAEVNNETYTFEFVGFDSNDLPYVPGQLPLEDHGLSINSIHYGDVLSFDFHNLDPFFQARYTYEGQKNLTGERPFVLTRGNFFGSGQFAAHWTGDNLASWEFLQLSIPQIFNFQLFGIPMIGADICGFMGDATPELCARWMQLGAFYPFMRNHNQIGSVPQEPYALGPMVMNTSRAALQFRYSVLKWYYSLFVRNGGTGTMFRPLFFHFPDDENIYDLKTQFLLGSELMVAVPVYEGMKEVGVYFPSGDRWYDLFTGRMIVDKNDPAVNVTVKAPLNATLPVFIRGGSIIHTQRTEGVKRTDDLNNTFNLVVAFAPISEDSSVAFGKIMGITDYLKDESIDLCVGENDCMVNIAASAVLDPRGTTTVELSFEGNTQNSTLQEIYIGNITFYGVREEICDFSESYCNWHDYKIECINKEPMLVDFGSISYLLNQEGCTRTPFSGSLM